MILNQCAGGGPSNLDGVTFTGIVHKYNLKGRGPRAAAQVTSGEGPTPVVNGVSMHTTANLTPQGKPVIYSPVAKFELNAALSNGALSYKPVFAGLLMAFEAPVSLSRTTEGYLLIEHTVIFFM